MAYHTSAGPPFGPLLQKHVYMAVEVLQAGVRVTPIGVAVASGQEEDGRTLWKLTISEAEMAGLWVVIDRWFRPAGSGP